MNKPIINGIDVSECAYFNSVIFEEPYCNIDQEHFYTCSSDENCYYKQLQRLKQENKKLKEVTNEAIIEHENLLINRNDFAVRAKKLEQENEELKNRLKTLDDEEFVYEVTEIEYNNFKKMNKYKQALEEIKKTILNYESKEWNCFNDMDAKLEKISEILDEVLNDRD